MCSTVKMGLTESEEYVLLVSQPGGDHVLLSILFKSNVNLPNLHKSTVKCKLLVCPCCSSQMSICQTESGPSYVHTPAFKLPAGLSFLDICIYQLACHQRHDSIQALMSMPISTEHAPLVLLNPILWHKTLRCTLRV